MSIPANGHLPASTGLSDHSSDSDSDVKADAGVDVDADYLPISGAAFDTNTDTDPDPDLASHHRLGAIDNSVSALDLASDDGEEDSDEEGQGPGEVAARAFSEDECRRRAPLPAGVTAWIVDAMRGVAFPDAPPSWAGTVPEDQWLDRLRSLHNGQQHGAGLFLARAISGSCP